MAEPATIQAASQAVKTFETFEALKAGLKEDRSLLSEFSAIQNDDEKVAEFVQNHVVPKAEAGATPQKPPAATETPDEEITFTGKLKKSDFGTYLKNRKPEEALLEMAKGNREKDTTIDFMKREKLPALETALNQERQTRERLEKENLSFKEQLEAFKKKQTEAPAAPKVEELDLEKIDLLDDDGQKKVKAALVNNAKALAASVAREDAQRAEINELKASITSVRESVENAGRANEVETKVEQQYTEIDMVRQRNRELFTSNRSVGDIEDDYVDFVKNLHAIAGLKGPLQDVNGQFTAEARQVYDLYHDEEKGKALKAECDKRGVKLPDDMDDLLVTYRINGIKNEYAKRDPLTGQYQPIPFDEALERYKLTLETPEQARLRGITEGHERYAKAVDNRKGFAKELPANAPGAPIDVSKLSETEIRAMFREYNEQKKKGAIQPELKMKLEHIIRSSNGGTEEMVGQLLGV
jgi:hypothetical protein